MAAIVILVAAAVLPAFFAGGQGENSRNYFMAAMLVAIFVPIMAYLIWMVYKMADKRKPEKNDGIENIIFDVGRVLMKFDWEGYLDSFQFPQEEREVLANEVFQSNIWNERDRGDHDEAYYVDAFVQMAPQYEKDIREVMRRSDETLSMFEYAETWVKYLKEQGYHLYILSNYSQYLLDLTKNQMKFLPYMDGIVFSCDVHQIKPEADIYRTVLGRYDLDPSRSVFIDDREDNCQAARRQGIHAIQFESFKQAAAELEKLGVK